MGAQGPARAGQPAGNAGGADDVVAVEVPATSANLGPGYDVLAAAVDLRLVAQTAPRGPERVSIDGEGAGELPTDDGNLVWRAFVAACERAGVTVPDVSLAVRSEIPLERGLGSSAAAAVAGAALARAAAGTAWSDHEIIALAADLEGHADNAAAAVLGGIVAFVDGRARRFDPAPILRPVLCVPTTRQSTSAARALLPAEVPLATAAASAGRAALVLAGLTGAGALDPWVLTDELHEPVRFTAMPDSGALVNALRAHGTAACLSGAGPSVLAVTAIDDPAAVSRVRAAAGEGWHIRASAWNRAGATACPPSVVPERRSGA